MKNGWKRFLEEHGPDATTEHLKNAIISDLFLQAAVRYSDIDWCIERLRQVKKMNGKAKRIIDIAMPSEDTEPQEAS